MGEQRLAFLVYRDRLCRAGEFSFFLTALAAVSADHGGCRQSRGLYAGVLFLRVVSADHDGVGAGSEDGADVRQNEWDPEPVVSRLPSFGTF